MIALRFALVLLFAGPLLGAESGYDFSLGGEPVEPLILPVAGEAMGRPVEGDVAFLRDFIFVVGKPGHYELRIDGERDSELLCRIDGGAEHHLAVRVVESYDDDDHRIDPLAKLDADQRQLLRGIALEVSTPDLKTALAGIDWSKTALLLTENLGVGEEQKSLPALPKEIRYLDLDIHSSPAIEDFSRLRDLTELRYFDLSGWGAAFDFRLLERATGLRNVSVQHCPVSHPGALAVLAELRFLKLRWTEGLDTVAFASSMPRLRVLKFDDTEVTDLRPLNGLEELRLLSATEAAVEHLPDAGTLPALRDVRLLSTPIVADEKAIAAFREAALPECSIRVGWAQALRDAVAGADRLRVRSGGTCHRELSREETIFEIREAAEIASLVAGLGIDEESSGGHCMCCGDPSLEFYRGDELRVTLGFHHGHGLRWSEGWPGDAMLSSESSDLLCALMAKHGYTGPQEERQREKRSDEAAERYWEAFFAIVPKAVMESAWDISQNEELDEDDRGSGVREVFATHWPDAAERAQAVFQLYGAVPEQSWNLTTGLDEWIRDHLLAAHAGEIEALLAAAPSEQVLQGTARWCFFDRPEEAPEITGKALAALAEWGLSHPREINRRKALLALDSEVGESLLLGFLREPATPRELADEWRPEPGGSVTYQPEPTDLPNSDVNRVTAAFLLAKRGCAEARPILKELAETGPEPERKHYAEALGRLDAERE